MLAVVPYVSGRIHTLSPGRSAGESLAAEDESDKAVRSKQLELGFLASLASDPGGHSSPCLSLSGRPIRRAKDGTHIHCECVCSNWNSRSMPVQACSLWSHI